MGRTSDANERLMDAALKLMWEESYGAVSIDDICKRADVKKGSFYYFFKSKAELAVAALEKMWRDDWKPALDSRFSPAVEPLTRLKAQLEAVYTVVVENQKQYGRVLGCIACSVGSEVSSQEEDVNGKIRELLSRKRKYYESAIRDAVAEGVIDPCDPTEKAIALACLIDGAVSQARIMNDPEILRSLPKNAFALLGVKPAAVAAADRC